MEVFSSGILGAGIGAAAGAYQKRTDPRRAAPVAGGTAVVVFLFVSAAFALFG
jgi:hypothetical protein